MKIEVLKNKTREDVVLFLNVGFMSSVIAYLLKLIPIEPMPDLINLIVAFAYIMAMCMAVMCGIGFVFNLLLYVTLFIIIKVKQIRQRFPVFDNLGFHRIFENFFLHGFPF